MGGGINVDNTWIAASAESVLSVHPSPGLCDCNSCQAIWVRWTGGAPGDLYVREFCLSCNRLVRDDEARLSLTALQQAVEQILDTMKGGE